MLSKSCGREKEWGADRLWKSRPDKHQHTCLATCSLQPTPELTGAAQLFPADSTWPTVPCCTIFVSCCTVYFNSRISAYQTFSNISSTQAMSGTGMGLRGLQNPWLGWCFHPHVLPGLSAVNILRPRLPTVFQLFNSTNQMTLANMRCSSLHLFYPVWLMSYKRIRFLRYLTSFDWCMLFIIHKTWNGPTYHSVQCFWVFPFCFVFLPAPRFWVASERMSTLYEDVWAHWFHGIHMSNERHIYLCPKQLKYWHSWHVARPAFSFCLDFSFMTIFYFLIPLQKKLVCSSHVKKSTLTVCSISVWLADIIGQCC